MRMLRWGAWVLAAGIAASWAAAPEGDPTRTACERVWTKIADRDPVVRARGLDITCAYNKRPKEYWRCMEAGLEQDQESWEVLLTRCKQAVLTEPQP